MAVEAVPLVGDRGPSLHTRALSRATIVVYVLSLVYQVATVVARLSEGVFWLQTGIAGQGLC